MVVCSALHAGNLPTTHGCTLTGNSTRDPWVHSSVLNPLSHTMQGPFFLYFFFLPFFFLWNHQFISHFNVKPQNNFISFVLMSCTSVNQFSDPIICTSLKFLYTSQAQYCFNLPPSFSIGVPFF